LVDVREDDVGFLLDEVFENLLLSLQGGGVAIKLQAAGVPHVVHPEGHPWGLSLINLQGELL
jgi:hypothetical protein